MKTNGIGQSTVRSVLVILAFGAAVEAATQPLQDAWHPTMPSVNTGAHVGARGVFYPPLRPCPCMDVVSRAVGYYKPTARRVEVATTFRRAAYAPDGALRSAATWNPNMRPRTGG